MGRRGPMRADAIEQANGGGKLPAKPPEGTPVAVAKVWRRIAPTLIQIGLARKADTALVLRYCQLTGLLEQATAALKPGVVEDDGEGGSKLSPALRGYLQISREMGNIESRLGLDPVSRRRMPSDGQKDIELDKERFFAEAQ